jgi:hypothetical protein
MIVPKLHNLRRPSVPWLVVSVVAQEADSRASKDMDSIHIRHTGLRTAANRLQDAIKHAICLNMLADITSMVIKTRTSSERPRLYSYGEGASVQCDYR